MLTFPRRALLWHKVMDLRPPRSSDDGSSSSQRGAKLTVYLLLTLRVILHFLPPVFFPVFHLFSCLFLAIFRGFTLEPAYEARLIFQHCLIMTTTSHFTLLSPALFLLFIPFFSVIVSPLCAIMILTSKMHPFLNTLNISEPFNGSEAQHLYV